MKTLAITLLLLGTSVFAVAQSEPFQIERAPAQGDTRNAITEQLEAQSPHTVTFTYKQVDPTWNVDVAHTTWIVEDRDATKRCMKTNPDSEILCRAKLQVSTGLTLTYTFQRTGYYVIHFVGTDTTNNLNKQKSYRVGVIVQAPVVVEHWQ